VKTGIKIALLSAALAAAPLLASAPAAADVGISFNVGDVAIGYSDGWYDRDHHWHAWRNDDERRSYQRGHANDYHEYTHDRDEHHDSDRDNHHPDDDHGH